MATNFTNHVTEARGLLRGYTGKSRIVGLFALGNTLDYLAGREGANKALLTWRESFDILRQTCERQGVSPLIVSPPEYAPGMKLFRGKPIDFDLYREQLAIADKKIREWNIPHISFETIVGEDKAACMDPGGRHPNALGYERIVTHLIPLINEQLGITIPASTR
jgi:hypothetical protein